MKKIYLLLFLVAMANCENRCLNIEREEAAIYSVLIDEMATPLPPPPPPSKNGSRIEPINTDSVSKVKVEMVVDTIMFQSSRTIDIDEEFSEYQSLVARIPSLAAKPLKKKI